MRWRLIKVVIKTAIRKNLNIARREKQTLASLCSSSFAKRQEGRRQKDNRKRGGHAESQPLSTCTQHAAACKVWVEAGKGGTGDAHKVLGTGTGADHRHVHSPKHGDFSSSSRDGSS